MAATPGPIDAGELGPLLAQLDAQASGRDHDAVAALRARLSGHRFRVLVVGEAKRGKSTLVNALLERDLVPTGTVPLTALPTVIRRGGSPNVLVSYEDGRRATMALPDLPDLITETRNPDNRLGVADVVVETPASLLDPGVDLVDTPGVGSVFPHSAATATDALDTMDAAVFVLSADPPVSASERALLARVRDRAVALFCVLNKVDNLTLAERAEVVAFTRDVLADTLHYRPRLYQVSARRARAAQAAADRAALRDSGLPHLREDLAEYLRSQRVGALGASVAGHAARLAARMLDQVTLTRQAAQLSAQRAGTQVARFSEQLTALEDYRRDATDVARASVDRLRRDLADAAGWDAPRMARSARAETATFLDAQPHGPAARLEDDARAHAVAAVERHVDAWHREREATIAEGLAQVDSRLAAEVERQLATVRQAARDLLGIELVLPATAGRLLPDVGVVYALDEELAVPPSWPKAPRRHLPGRWGRRAVRAHLLREVDRLVTRQVGRVHAALDQVLRPAAGALVHCVETRYTDAAAGLIAALGAARDLAGSAGTAAGLRDLDTRAGELRQLATRLDATHEAYRQPSIPVGGTD